MSNEIADERAFDGRRFDPGVAGFHLQAAVLVLRQQGQQAVVGVFADTPFFVRRRGRIFEHAKEQRWVGGIGAAEIVRVEIERARDALHEGVGAARGFIHKTQHGGLQRGQVGWKLIASVQRQASADARIVVTELFAEIHALLLVRLAGGEFAAHWKVAAPSAAAAGHRDLHFLGLGEREECAARFIQRGERFGADGVAGCVEEAEIAARGADFRGDTRPRGGVAAQQRPNVDNRQMLGHEP